MSFQDYISLFPNHWNRVSLGEILDFKNGINFSANQKGSGILTVDVLNMYSDQLDIITDNLYRVDTEISADKLLKPGDILFVRSSVKESGVGYPAMFKGFNEPVTYCGFIIRGRPKQKNFDSRFLIYYLRQPRVRQQMVASSGKTAITNISQERLQPLIVPLPPLEEQHRIAAMLDKADAIRRKRAEAIRLTEELLRAAFLEMFGDPVTNPNLGKLPDTWSKCTVDELKANSKWSCVGGPFGSNLTAQDYISYPGIPVIRGSNLSVCNLYMSEDDFVFVSEQKAETLIQNMAYPGDVIFTQRGTLGQVGMISNKSQFERYIVSQSQMKLTPNLDLVNPIWLVSYFQSPIAQKYLEKQTLATGVPHINLGILKNFPINLPPLEQQIKYSNFANKHLDSKATYDKCLLATHKLFNSLLHRAFKGELYSSYLN